MCGIVGVVSSPPTRPTPDPDEILGGLDEALARCPDVAAVVVPAGHVDALLRGLPGVLALTARVDLVAAIVARLDQLDAFAADVEARLDANDDPAGVLEAAALERANADLIGLKDALWAIRHDRLRTARLVGELAGRDAGTAAVQGYLSIQQALSAIDRLEVRGRDSAGLHVFVWNHDIDPGVVEALVSERGVDPLFQSRTVIATGPTLSFVYKAAAEIGELGDNTAVFARRRRRRHAAAEGAHVAGQPTRRARPHTLGKCRHHQRAQHASAQLRRTRDAGWRDAAVCRRRVER